MYDPSIRQRMLRQHGVISRSQALELGMSSTQISYRLKQREWIRIHRGVFRHVMAPPTWRTRAAAATLAGRGVASHRTAAQLHGLNVSQPHPTEITVPNGRWVDLAGVTVHQSTQVDRLDRRRIDGIECTGLARTVLDLGAVVPRYKVSEAVDSLLCGRRITLASLWDVLTRHARCARNGCGVLRQVLDERRADEAVPLSEWSRMVMRLLMSAGLPRPAMEHRVVDGNGRFLAQVDLAYPPARLAIELDSVAFHHNLASFRSDRVRTRRLTLDGWRVLQFTWDDYANRPGEVVDQVRKLCVPEMGG